MVVLQIINKIIKNGNIDLITDNNLTREMFLDYEDEFDYIMNHLEKYNKVPDKETFLNQFKEFNLLEVTESDKYLIDKLREEYLYYKTVPIIQESAKLLQVNSNEAVEFLYKSLPNLNQLQETNGVDIISDSDIRLNEYKAKIENKDKSYITTGFEELDSIFKGFARGEELVVLFARIGQGKSWILNKMLAHSWQIGMNVGLVSPEMSSTKIGYRFDTLVGHFSNKDLVWGNEQKDYEKHLENLKKQKNKYIVTVPQDFDKKITVTKLKNFILKNKLDILGIDGITYLTDERYKKGDNRTTMLTNISEDLMSLSLELKIPILVVVQSNRNGASKEDDETPDLENIKDSDGIGANATKVIAIKQKSGDNIIQLSIRKHRDGITGQTLLYNFDFDKGNFTYIPSNDDGLNKNIRAKRINNLKKEFKNDEDVF